MLDTDKGMARAEELRQEWQERVRAECPQQSMAAQDSIVRWLIGEDTERFEAMEGTQLAIARQAMDYRFRILQQRYLGLPQDRAYKNLLQRLSSLALVRNKVRTGVALSRDRHRTVMDVLQEVIQQLIQSDTYIRQQMQWIAQCAPDPRLRNALTLASVEEYCLRPIRNQPLLVYRFVNYLRQSQRGGMTQVPTGELIRLVSDEIAPDDAENPMSLVDNEALAQYQEQQVWEEQQAMREDVKREFLRYLEEKVEPAAARWLELHLQGKTQEAIAKALDMPIRQVYRLREKISYHAVRVFALKTHSDLVTTWLGTSLEQNLGLTPDLWNSFWQSLTPLQQGLIYDLKAKMSFEAIAKARGLKTNQVSMEWIKLYLSAQALRGASPQPSAELETEVP